MKASDGRLSQRWDGRGGFRRARNRIEDHLVVFFFFGFLAPDLFSSENESTETEDLLSPETSENISDDDDLEIPAFLRRQKN